MAKLHVSDLKVSVPIHDMEILTPTPQSCCEKRRRITESKPEPGSDEAGQPALRGPN